MLEFRIVTQHGNARPFSLWTFNSFEACYCKLYEFIQDKKTHVSPEYYVINDFYDNEYPPFLNDITKYKIECREVENWELYSKNKKKKQTTPKVVNLFN